MTCAAFGSEDATSFASAGGAQPALHTNTTGDLDVVACHPGIYFDPISVMADDQGSPVLSAGDDLLHRESVCGELGVRCDAGGPTTEAVHANMLRPSAPGLGGFRLSDRHQNATEGLPSPLLASPLGWHVRVTAVDALLEARSATICNNDSGMSSSLAAAKEANLLAGSAKESASLAEQCSKGETNCAIGHALPQPHPSSSELRSSVGSVGWPPQWAPFFLAQMPSPPQPPPSMQQRSFSLSSSKSPRQPSPPPVLNRIRSPTAPSAPGAMVVSSRTAGPVMTTTASDVALHGRHLNEVSASTVGEFTAAVGNSAVDKILLAAGTYELTSDMCTASAVCIDRALTIEAEVPGAVVLNAMGARRVFNIQSGGTAELIGLNITGGHAPVQSARLLNPLRHFLQFPANRTHV